LGHTKEIKNERSAVWLDSGYGIFCFAYLTLFIKLKSCVTA